jgi:quercetin dioxygenase-like cupin family protein
MAEAYNGWANTTRPRSTRTSWAATFRVAHGGSDSVTVDLPDLSNVAIEQLTFQPGAQLPWHTHAGANIATVIQGEIVYMGDDCVEHSYPAGSTFVDPGQGHIHTAMNPTAGESIVLTVHLDAPAEGPTRVVEGVAAPDCAADVAAHHSAFGSGRLAAATRPD